MKGPGLGTAIKSYQSSAFDEAVVNKAGLGRTVPPPAVVMPQLKDSSSYSLRMSETPIEDCFQLRGNSIAYQSERP